MQTFDEDRPRTDDFEQEEFDRDEAPDKIVSRKGAIAELESVAGGLNDGHARWPVGNIGAVIDYLQSIPDIRIGEHDRAHVGEAINGTHWSAKLLQLIAKSDLEHREALRFAFPTYVAAFERWHAGPQEEAD